MSRIEIGTIHSKRWFASSIWANSPDHSMR